MPSPSAARHRGSMIRQLSLQGQSNSQSLAGRKGLKKQLSEDDSRSRNLDSVEITGQGWAGNNDRAETGLRMNFPENAKFPGHLKTATNSRPRPVKLAWTDHKPDNAECAAGVEIVARKCQGQPRPLTTKAQRIMNLPLLGDKDTLVYTRQQLAERLRVAWREREKSKPNLNIFLAHAQETTRSNNDEQNSGRSEGIPQVIIQDSVSFRSVSASESSLSSGSRRNSSSEPVRVLCCTGDDERMLKLPAEIVSATKASEDSERKPDSKTISGQPKRLDAKEKIEVDVGRSDVSRHGGNRPISDCPDFKTFPAGESSNTFGSNLTNLNYQAKAMDAAPKTREDPKDDRLSKGKENIESSPRSDSGYSELGKSGKADELNCKFIEIVEEDNIKPQGTAKERRASFRSGYLVNKTIDESCSPPTSTSGEETEDDAAQINGSEIRVFLKKNDDQRPTLSRTISAPIRNEFQPSKQANSHMNSKIVATPKTATAFTSSIDLTAIEEDATTLRGRIKSAPIRRKLKTAGTRRKHREKEADSSEDEVKQCRDTSKKKNPRRKATPKMNASDIITMVSLVSPATSDAEDANAVIPLPEETWVAEEREEKAAAAIQDAAAVQKATNDQPKEMSSFVFQKFVSLKKTTKTVSFIQHTPVNRSYSASFPSRRAPAGTPIIIPTPVITNPALTPAQLQEREKRPQPSSPGTSAGTDTRGVKRRLIRTASEPQIKEIEKSSKNVTISKEERAYDELPKKIEEEESEEKKEPEFKSPKEKECWVLYQKMVEKGVSVSFDTVLRGMLTPTEYRLRKNQLLSAC